MTSTSAYPNIRDLHVPMDAWTEPFWEHAARSELKFPRCTRCCTFRWPSGPFCPKCSNQGLEWCPAGEGRIYSFTTFSRPKAGVEGEQELHIAALVEFPEAGAVRLLSAVVDTPPSLVEIGAAVTVCWAEAPNANIPVFRLKRVE